MPSIKEAANEFLADKRIAVIGVSRDPKGHGSNLVYRRLRERGYEVFAINPNADEVEGDPCYHDLKTIPGGVDAVVVGTRPEIAEDTIANVRTSVSSGCGCIARSVREVCPTRRRSTAGDRASP
jgi:hypothetical protein